MLVHPRALTRRGLGTSLEQKRALLEPRLKALGLGVLPGSGAYFLVADVRCPPRPALPRCAS